MTIGGGFMDEMRDSTPFVDDGARLREEIANEGYVLLRGLVDRDTAQTVGDRVRQTLAEHGWIRRVDGQEEVLRIPPKGAEPEDYWTMYSAVLGLDGVNALAWQPRLQQVMRGLLGPTCFALPSKVVRLVFPAGRGGQAIPIHRDNRGGPWVRDLFTTWVALGRIDAAMGGFALLRGSQTYRYQALQEPGAPPPDGTGLAIPGDESSEWVATGYEPGDVVLFHCYTVHKGLPNRSDRVRVSADYRWQRTEYPVHVSTMLPYHYFDQYPRIASWNEMAEGWRERWDRFPAEVQVSYEKWPEGSDDRVPPSEFVPVVPGARETWRPSLKDSDEFRVPHELPERMAVPS